MDSAPVIILGAGLSGLRAAVALKRKGHAVIVLEARDRIGGRVDTRTLGNMTVEMGAEWIGTKDTLMRELCKEYGLELIDHQLTTHLLYEGKYFAPGEWTADAGWEKTLQEIVERFPSLTNDEVTRLQNVDWWHYLGQHHVSVRDRHILDLIRSSDFGEDMRFVPAYDVLYDYAVGGDDETACMYTIRGGNQSLARAMMEEIGAENVVLGEEAIVVEQTEEGVTVTTKSGKTYQGKALIAAIPTLAVTNIDWRPGLPITQADAYNQVTYSRILKTAVGFDTNFWGEEDYELITDRLPQQIYHATPGQEGKGEALISYAVGDKADVLAHMTDSEKAEEIREVLAVPFGEDVAAATHVISYYWGDDPYTGGAYPMFERGDRTILQPLLRAPHGKIHFAGEHTAVRYGFMEGAVEAGERAASEVLESLSI